MCTYEQPSPRLWEYFGYRDPREFKRRTIGYAVELAMRYTCNIILGLTLLFLPGCRSGQEPSTEEINALKTQVQRGSPPAFVPQTDDGRKVWSATQKVYELRGFRPVWIARGQTTRRVDSLIRTFESTEAEGFSAEDLGMADLHAKREAIKTSRDLEQLIEFDMYFTYSLVRCGSYLSSGRADPRTIDPNWRYVPRNDNLAQIVNDAIEANTLEKLPEKLSPPHPEYVALKEMLRKYREIGAKGGWSTLPVDLTLKQGENNPNVAVLRNNLAITGDLKTTAPGNTAFDSELSEAVLRFETRHGLKPDGILDPQVIAIMNVPVDFRIRQLEANLERLRWLPNDLGARHVLVNIPAYELEVREGNQVPLKMKVVVGTNEQSHATIQRCDGIRGFQSVLEHTRKHCHKRDVAEDHEGSGLSAAPEYRSGQGR